MPLAKLINSHRIQLLKLVYISWGNYLSSHWCQQTFKYEEHSYSDRSSIGIAAVPNGSYQGEKTYPTNLATIPRPCWQEVSSQTATPNTRFDPCVRALVRWVNVPHRGRQVYLEVSEVAKVEKRAFALSHWIVLINNPICIRDFCLKTFYSSNQAVICGLLCEY